MGRHKVRVTVLLSRRLLLKNLNPPTKTRWHVARLSCLSADLPTKASTQEAMEQRSWSSTERGARRDTGAQNTNTGPRLDMERRSFCGHTRLGAATGLRRPCQVSTQATPTGPLACNSLLMKPSPPNNAAYNGVLACTVEVTPSWPSKPGANFCCNHRRHPRSLSALLLVMLSMLAPARALVISFTGNVTRDFPIGPGEWAQGLPVGTRGPNLERAAAAK